MQLLPEKEILKGADRRRCPDYDEECVDVEDPLHCYLGAGCLGLAEGYCPLLYKPSQPPEDD